jgi:organic hydroperoxide reductase OsmC/OhrA
MSEHRATVEWQRSGEFRYETYSRAHTLRFDDISVPGNAAPANIPSTVPKQSGVDPEQAFVAALSSCHMLWFLHLACQKKWISRVTLRPDVTLSGNAPTAEELRALHHQAHEKCFIANSVKTEVLIEPC